MAEEIVVKRCPQCNLALGVFYESVSVQCPSCKTDAAKGVFIPNHFIPIPANCPYKRPHELHPKEEMEVCLKTWEERGQKMSTKETRYWKNYFATDPRVNASHPANEKRRIAKEKAVEYTHDLQKEGIALD